MMDESVKLHSYLPPELDVSHSEKRELSYPFLQENSFTLLRQHSRKPKKGLLRGPRRVLRLILFGLIVPAILITVPLYVRLILYPPHHYAMSPTDQRLLHGKTSGIWCQAQLARMNGSFNAYLMPDKAQISDNRRRHEMLENLRLKDDVKEYWGFHLLKGSTVTISTCTKWDGGQLMILRGVENLRRCAWIGEEDSLEEFEEMPSYVGNRFSDEENPKVLNVGPEHTEEAISNERKAGMKMLIGEVLKLSKTKKEILKLLHNEGREKHYSMDIEEIKQRGRLRKGRRLPRKRKGSMEENFPHLSKLFDISKVGDNHTDLETDEHNVNDANVKKNRHFYKKRKGSMEDNFPHLSKLFDNSKVTNKDTIIEKDKHNENYTNVSKDKYVDKEYELTNRNSVEKSLIKDKSDRLRRSISNDLEEYDDGAYEEEEYEYDGNSDEASQEAELDVSSAEFSVGAQLFQRKGLKFEKGIFNQTNKGDGSNEEHRSSYSSSEEALAACDGVIMALPLMSDRRCRNFKRAESNKISYDIPISGTYYFVFSSDNEVFVNDVFINITMEKVVYETNYSAHTCFNKTECSLPLSFWSSENTVVEVPETNWQDSFLLDTACDPRVSVYLVFIFFVPILILFCALN